MYWRSEKRLALTANQPAGIFRLHVQQQSLRFGVLDGGGKAISQRIFPTWVWLRRHRLVEGYVNG